MQPMGSELKRRLSLTDDSFSSSDEESHKPPKKRRTVEEDEERSILKTIDLKKLDFDQEKICSVTLSSSNVYCCLVCGRYLQGRGQSSVAFRHAVETNDQVFLSFSTLKVYILPENCEITVAKCDLLKQIVYAVNPIFKAEEIQSFPMECYDSGNKRYYNGFVGMNNISPDGYSVAVLQAIAHISSVRDYFLIRRSIELTSHHFLDNVSLLLRKLALVSEVVKKKYFTAGTDAFYFNRIEEKIHCRCC